MACRQDFIESLEAAMQMAGGGGATWEAMREMSVSTLADILAANGVRFTHDSQKTAEEVAELTPEEVVKIIMGLRKRDETWQQQQRDIARRMQGMAPAAGSLGHLQAMNQAVARDISRESEEAEDKEFLRRVNQLAWDTDLEMLAERIMRSLFGVVGAHAGDPPIDCDRMALKVGRYGVDEKDMGGRDRESARKCILFQLREWWSDTVSKKP